LGQPVRLSGGGAASSHFESYADAAVKSNACALPSGAGFQTARERSTIETMNIERRVKEAQRRAKAEAKRAKREPRRQQKSAPQAGSAKQWAMKTWLRVPRNRACVLASHSMPRCSHDKAVRLVT
jgi:hypothetical protein